MFITFEGGEGCGKSTQAKALYRRLSRSGVPTVLTHEPGGTPLGKELRKWLKWREGTTPLTELLLFATSRTQLVSKVIRPSLEQGAVVICDRYADSTLAYQGYSRGMDLNIIQQVNQLATQGILPDLVILLDIPAEVGLARKGKAKPDHFEKEEIPFHQRVRQGYLEMAKKDPERWLVVDAFLPTKEVKGIIWENVKELL